MTHNVEIVNSFRGRRMCSLPRVQTSYEYATVIALSPHPLDDFWPFEELQPPIDGTGGSISSIAVEFASADW